MVPQNMIPAGRNGPISTGQVTNLNKVLQISRQFFLDAGLEGPAPERISPDTTVIESGHQPNFLPYPGIFKKAFLVESLLKTVEGQGLPAVGVYGFADRNLSTAARLGASRLPAVNRDGFERIGFKITDKDRWKQFCSVDKPSPDSWEEKMTQIRNFYKKYLKELPVCYRDCHETIDRYLELFSSKYRRAENFADLNAFIFATLCQECFGLKRICFFRYSDIYKNHIFLQEALRLAGARNKYITLYNSALSQQGVTEIGPLPFDHVPVWYHCSCGKKLEIKMNEPSLVRARCDQCDKDYIMETDQFQEHYHDLDFTAVSRNLIFAEGLGTAFFVSGTGGSLEYGKISEAIGRSLGFRVPYVMAWGGRDYYFGPQHLKMLRLLKQAFSLEDSDFTCGTIQSRIDVHTRQLSEELERISAIQGNESKKKNLQGQLNNCVTQLMIAKKFFSVIPSVLDIMVASGPAEVVAVWGQSLVNGESQDVEGGGRLKRDCVYSSPYLNGNELSSITLVYQSFIQAEVHK